MPFDPGVWVRVLQDLLREMCYSRPRRAFDLAMPGSEISPSRLT